MQSSAGLVIIQDLDQMAPPRNAPLLDIHRYLFNPPCLFQSLCLLSPWLISFMVLSTILSYFLHPFA